MNNDFKQNSLKIISAIDEIFTKENIWYSLNGGSVLGAVRHEGFIPWDDDIDIYVRTDEYDKVVSSLKKHLPSDMKLYKKREDLKFTHFIDVVKFKDDKNNPGYVDVFQIIGTPEEEIKRKKFINKSIFWFKLLHSKNLNFKYTNEKLKLLITKPIAKLFSDNRIEKIYNKFRSSYSLNESSYFYSLGTGYGIKGSMPKEVFLNTKRVKFEHLLLPIPINYDNYLKRLYGNNYMTPQKVYKKTTKEDVEL